MLPSPGLTCLSWGPDFDQHQPSFHLTICVSHKVSSFLLPGESLTSVSLSCTAILRAADRSTCRWRKSRGAEGTTSVFALIFFTWSNNDWARVDSVPNSFRASALIFFDFSGDRLSFILVVSTLKLRKTCDCNGLNVTFSVFMVNPRHCNR